MWWGQHGFELRDRVWPGGGSTVPEAGADPTQKVTKSVKEDGRWRKRKLTLMEWSAEAACRHEKGGYLAQEALWGIKKIREFLETREDKTLT